MGLFGFGGKRSVVLVIDDSALIRQVIKGHLEAHGYEIVEASGGAEGIELAKSKKPGLILLDIQMPGISGTEACRLLKADKSTAHIPIMMCSTVQLMKDVERAFSFGACGYVIKPVDPEKLLKKVGDILPPPGKEK